jgi:hypothetical protein
MVQIARSYVAQVGLDTDRGGMPQPQLSKAMANAVGNLGGAIADWASVGKIAEQKKKQKDEFKSAADYRRLQLGLGRQLQERADNSDIMPVDGEGFHDDYITNVYNPERQKFLDGLPSDELRERYLTLLGDDGVDREEWSIKAAERENGQTQSWALQTLGEGQNELATAISLDPKGYDALLKQGFDEIDAAPRLTTKQKMDQRAAWERMAQVSVLNKMLETDPEGAMRELGADPRYLSPTTQYDMLERALMTQENASGDPNAISPKGAVGLMQVMPRTAVEISKELGDGLLDAGMSNERITSIMSNANTNRRYGNYYLKKQIRDFGKQGGLEAALIAYNGGPERAKKWIASGFDDSVIPKESANYYKAIMARLPGMRGASGGDPKSVQIDFRSPGDSIELSQDLQDRVKTSFASLGLNRIKVNSGHRTVAENRKAGGAEKSQHIHGNAMDIDVSGYSTAERIQIIQTLSANGITGLGIGSNIIHADLGGRRAWGYKTSAGGGEVPKWAQAAIADHLAGKSAAPTRGGIGVAGRFASLPYDDRQKFIHQADQAVTQRFNVTSKENAVQRVEMRQSMQNELSSLTATGQSTGLDETQVATVLGEDDYVKFARDKNVAQRMYSARQGIGTMTLAEMNDRVEDYRADPGSANYADDQKIETAVQREIDKVTKLRSSNPSEAVLLYPDVKAAYDAVQTGMQQGNLDPQQVQDYVRLTLERQKEFNLKPGSEAPVPQEWAMEIGRSLSRIPAISREMKITDVNAAILIQYQELQKLFGDYTDEVILHALSEYNGVGKNTADLITGYMTAIQVGGDPLKLMRTRDRATDADQQEQVTDDGWWSSIKRGASEFWSGERQPDEVDEDPGDPDLEAAPSTEVILRVIGQLNGATPEEEADIAARYGQRAYEAAKRRLAAGEQ